MAGHCDILQTPSAREMVRVPLLAYGTTILAGMEDKCELIATSRRRKDLNRPQFRPTGQVLTPSPGGWVHEPAAVAGP